MAGFPGGFGNTGGDAEKTPEGRVAKAGTDLFYANARKPRKPGQIYFTRKPGQIYFTKAGTDLFYANAKAGTDLFYANGLFYALVSLEINRSVPVFVGNK